MPVKIVTDSTCDLSSQVVRDLGITVVPVYVRFGEKVYRDGIDISHDELYQKLETDHVFPTTSQPSPNDFTDVYKELSKETDEIVSIHVTNKLSGTYNSALQGKAAVKGDCCIEVVDSLSLSMGLGLITMAAARLAKAGEGLQSVMAEVKQAIPQIRLLALFDTLKYLHRGGRIGRATALLGSLLNVKPLLTMKDGEFVPASQARTRARGIERLFDFAKNTLHIQESAVIHSTSPGEANSLRERIASISDEGHQTRLARLGPALGVHGGPGTIGVVVRSKVNDTG